MLLLANIAVFAWTTLHGVQSSDRLLVQYGAFYGPLVAAGEWWRTFTAGFLHANLLHIATNMFVLWQVGTVVEHLFGSPKMAAVYFFSLIGSGIAIYEFNFTEVTIGASGAIFGLFGALVAAGLRLGPPGRDLVRSMIGIVLLNLIIGFVVPNISMAGHVGGLIAGFISGSLIYRRPRPRTWASPYASTIAQP
ncbi:MAG: rhomboid family intramembrane serine protease [Candidatus Eremiobacteraeota bacterium]|nr:rhomboid family intramembrane serine protease [Candidatus Eremiobacteraeota bacterium]